jgi:hypothetical protein
MKKEVKKVKVNNKALAKTLGISVGAIIEVECKNGVPVNREWRNRFKDAEIDNCIEITKSKLKKEA